MTNRDLAALLRQALPGHRADRHRQMEDSHRVRTESAAGVELDAQWATFCCAIPCAPGETPVASLLRQSAWRRRGEAGVRACMADAEGGGPAAHRDLRRLRVGGEPMPRSRPRLVSCDRPSGIRRRRGSRRWRRYRSGRARGSLQDSRLARRHESRMVRFVSISRARSVRRVVSIVRQGTMLRVARWHWAANSARRAPTACMRRRSSFCAPRRRCASPAPGHRAARPCLRKPDSNARSAGRWGSTARQRDRRAGAACDLFGREAEALIESLQPLPGNT